VYDPTHGIYHLFFQDHLAEPAGGGAGPVYGHAASRDLAHWTRLPVAIWNDEEYDSQAIYTGSATVVDGEIYQLYPSMCRKQQWPNGSATGYGWPDCETGGGLSLAIPANRSDPFLTHWSKDIPGSQNPIANNTQRDPTSAWKTPSGEWRINTYNSTLFGSKDFKTWYEIGQQPGWELGECPSFFPLPRTTPGAKAAEGRSPSHVYKRSSAWSDAMQVGTYTDGAPGKVGVWVPWPTQGPRRSNASVGIGMLQPSFPRLEFLSTSFGHLLDRPRRALRGEGHDGSSARKTHLLGMECVRRSSAGRAEPTARADLAPGAAAAGALAAA